MDSLNFYALDKIDKDSISDELFEQIIKEANRFKILENTDLSKVCDRMGLPHLTPNRPSEWKLNTKTESLTL